MLKTKALQEKLTEARKSGNKVAMGLLQVILGEISTIESRLDEPLNEERISNIIRGVRDRNNETLAMIAGKARQDDEKRLITECEYLTTLLPKTLTLDEIKFHLQDIMGELTSINAGQSVGKAIKYLKGKGLLVLGNDVKTVIESIKS